MSSPLVSLLASPARHPTTLTEKIVQCHSLGLAPGKKVKSGDYVTLKPAQCMTHDNSFPVMTNFMSIGATEIKDNKQVVMTLYHDTSPRLMASVSLAQAMALAFGAGHGIGHQVMVEEGFAWPGTITVASDSHSNMYGGVGSLGTPVVRTDACSIWSTSKTWWQIPPVAKVTLTGMLPPGVTGKDIIVALCGLFNKDEVLNHAIEFVGSEETMRSLPVEERLTIANMTTECGALSGLFPIDKTLESWLRARAALAAMAGANNDTSTRFNHERIDEMLADTDLAADPGAVYAKSVYLNLATLSPFVSDPNSVKVATPSRTSNLKTSRSRRRISDIYKAAEVVRDAAEKGLSAKFAPGVEYYMAAASKAEQAIAEEAVGWQVLLEAGRRGRHQCLRNFKGRIGDPNALAYLAIPEVVTASALQGKIAGPGWYHAPEDVTKPIIGEGTGDHVADQAMSIEEALEKIISQADSMIAQGEKDLGSASAESTAAAPEEEALTEILPGFPEQIEGEIVWADADNINTDGIYPGKYTYQDDVSVETMAKVCMQNYDPDFGKVAKAGDILVSGFNFGTGSSREQAATSILAKKLPLVVSGSFGNTFSRNSINNGLLGVEVPNLVQRLRETFGKDKVLTRRTGWTLKWDLRRSKVTVTEKGGETWSVKVGEMPPNVQDIIGQGGLEPWIQKQISK
ncbi:hypothetical protein ACHAQH_006655 [Verticillium albo-atrum]